MMDSSPLLMFSGDQAIKTRQFANHGGIPVGLALNGIYRGDCVKLLSKLDLGTIDLAFADPPFNIGYEYDVYEDQQSYQDYLRWTRDWMSGVSRVLKPTGAFWIAIGDEYAAEVKLIAQNDLGLTCRSWVIWYYTFGVNCTRKFTRSHAHLFHFVKDPRSFTFNADDPAIRVPSARQLVYADTRANPKGRLPDDTWILRPQDVSGGFGTEQDTWYFPRVAGTFKERAGFHGCQMPEQLLGRIIRACSNSGDTVLDPFAGSGTTLVVAKKLARQWIGFDLSKDYVAKATERVCKARAGEALNGAAEPLTSAPKTPKAGSKTGGISTNGHRPRPSKPSVAVTAVRPPKRPVGHHLPTRDDTQLPEAKQLIIAAYQKSHDGHSTDLLLARPELNSAFIDACKQMGVPGQAKDWNRLLLGLRKSGLIPLSKSTGRMYTWKSMDEFSFASEIALQQMITRNARALNDQLTLDDILCDPELAAEFDRIAGQHAPGYSSFQYRWAALHIRKRARRARKAAAGLTADLASLRPPRAKRWCTSLFEQWCGVPAVYALREESKKHLYIGETFDLGRRLRRHDDLSPSAVQAVTLNRPQDLEAVKSSWIGTHCPLLNYAGLAFNQTVAS